MLKAGQHNCKQVHTIDSTCHLELPLGGRDVSGDAEVGRGRLQRVFSTTKAHISAKKKNGVAEHSSVADPKIQPYAKARRSIGMTEEETSRRNQASAHVSQFLCQRAPTVVYQPRHRSRQTGSKGLRTKKHAKSMALARMIFARRHGTPYRTRPRPQAYGQCSKLVCTRRTKNIPTCGDDLH